jgi:serine/threonine-protein kinase
MTPGAILNEKYRLIEQIGEGGMATIWRAVQISLDRPVAVKFISASGPSAARYVERFLAEAKLAAAIRHRNVIDIVDFGTSDEGTAYMVLELLQGESLADRMARLPALNLGEVVNIAVLVLSGLQAVHNAGVVHRDLKPENIFLVTDDDGAYPKLLDFGVSKSVDRKDGRAPTQEGVLIGTPQYMAPEQARGIRDVDHRIDIWAIGVILYEVLTGKLPYDSENVGDILIKIVSEDAPPITFLRPEIGPELAAVVQRAMARNRDERYQDAKEMRAAIMDAAAKLGDAAGMWGRITPGAGSLRPEELHTPISGLIQVVAVEHARAVQRAEAAAVAANAATEPQPVLTEAKAADALARTMPAIDRPSDGIRTPSVTVPLVRRDPTDDVQLVRTSRVDVDMELPASPPPPKKKSGGTAWVFLVILLLGGGAAVALALNPALLDRLNALVEGSAALSEIAADLGIEDADAGPLDVTAEDAGVSAADVAPNAGLLEDAGLDDDVAGGEDAGVGEDANVGEDAGLDAGAPDEEQVRPTKRVVRRHPARRPVRRPARRPARRR